MHVDIKNRVFSCIVTIPQVFYTMSMKKQSALVAKHLRVCPCNTLSN